MLFFFAKPRNEIGKKKRRMAGKEKRRNLKRIAVAQFNTFRTTLIIRNDVKKRTI